MWGVDHPNSRHRHQTGESMTHPSRAPSIQQQRISWSWSAVLPAWECLTNEVIVRPSKSRSLLDPRTSMRSCRHWSSLPWKDYHKQIANHLLHSTQRNDCRQKKYRKCLCSFGRCCCTFRSTNHTALCQVHLTSWRRRQAKIRQKFPVLPVPHTLAAQPWALCQQYLKNHSSGLLGAWFSCLLQTCPEVVSTCFNPGDRNAPPKFV